MLVRDLRHAVQLSLFVLDLLLNQILFLLAQIHLIHLDHKLVPGLLLLDLFSLLLRVLRLNVSLDALSPFAGAIRWLYLLARCRLLRLLLLLGGRVGVLSCGGGRTRVSIAKGGFLLRG